MSASINPNIVLVDSSFLYAIANPADVYHKRAIAFAMKDKRTQVIPEVVLTEALFLVGRFVSHHAMMRFLKSLAYSSARFEPVTQNDLKRAYAIMEQYADARLDFVDCCLFALRERLNIQSICTFDRSDFALFRPSHCEYLDLLP